MKLVTKNELTNEMGVPYSHVHIWRLVKAGQFPAPLKLGPRKVAWLRSEVEEWIEQKAAERCAA